MRLFVALPPPAGVCAELDAAVEPLRAGWPALRWATPDRWHVTLAFLGEVDEARSGNLAGRLERTAARHEHLTLRIGSGGTFGSARRARVLCAHIEGDQQALSGLKALAASVAAAARRAGAPPLPDKGRRFRPHLTIARCRQPTDVSELVSALAGFSGSAWTADHMELIRSYTGPQPRYETIGSWPLGKLHVDVEHVGGAGDVPD